MGGVLSRTLSIFAASLATLTVVACDADHGNPKTA
jgi:hypothetical protein